MKLKELLENIEAAVKSGWVTHDDEITVEILDKKKVTGNSTNDSFHVHGWNVYYMLDKVFSLSVDLEADRFNELEYEDSDTPDDVEQIVWDDKIKALKARMAAGDIEARQELMELFEKMVGWKDEDGNWTDKLDD